MKKSVHTLKRHAIASISILCLMFGGLDAHLMLTKLPGVFCAGEMLDWEAPTGGYLLTASLASGRQAGRGVVKYLNLMESQRS